MDGKIVHAKSKTQRTPCFLCLFVLKTKYALWPYDFRKKSLKCKYDTLSGCLKTTYLKYRDLKEPIGPGNIVATGFNPLSKDPQLTSAVGTTHNWTPF
jgi:hypothetical protein